MAEDTQQPDGAAEPASHYALLGMEPVGKGSLPVEQVMQLASLSLEDIKRSYKSALDAAPGNPFKLAKLAKAFQVLSGDGRKVYDLQLMQKAASVAWFIF